MRRSLAAGEEIAGYRIESFLARGGMAVVYRARDVRLDRRVALKLLAPELTRDEGFRRRFMRESKLAASIDHPHIIPIYRAGQVGDLLYLSMRYVEGADLGALLARDGPLALPKAVTILEQLAGALDAAHAHGLVHRDVKPGNVLVAAGAGGWAGGHVYLSDFGLTKRATSMSGLTAMGHFLGTIDYVSPEQITGQPIGAWTDVYALGCVLFEVLTGDRPFTRPVEEAVLYAHLSEPPPSVRARRRDLPPAVDRVVATAMAKEPRDRYATCRDLVADLRAAGRDATGPDRVLPSAARPALPAGPRGPVPTRRRPVRSLASPAGQNAGPSPGRRPAPRRGGLATTSGVPARLILWLVAAVLFVVALAVIALWR